MCLGLTTFFFQFKTVTALRQKIYPSLKKSNITTIFGALCSSSSMLEIGCIFMRFLRIDHCDKEIIDYEKSYRIMSGIGLFSIIINLPMFWSFNWDSDLPCKLSDLYCNETFHLLALTLPHIIIRFILPTIFLIYVNFFTLKEVRN